MQYMATAVKRARLIILGLALLLSVGFGSVAATPSEVGFTECDQSGCAVGYPAGTAFYQIINVNLWHGDFVSDGPLDVGFTP